MLRSFLARLVDAEVRELRDRAVTDAAALRRSKATEQRLADWNRALAAELVEVRRDLEGYRLAEQFARHMDARRQHPAGGEQ